MQFACYHALKAKGVRDLWDMQTATLHREDSHRVRPANSGVPEHQRGPTRVTVTAYATTGRRASR